MIFSGSVHEVGMGRVRLEGANGEVLWIIEANFIESGVGNWGGEKRWLR